MLLSLPTALPLLPFFCQTDRMSISSYRTDISMADFQNSRDFGGHDNMGATPDTQETVLEGKDGMCFENAQALGKQDWTCPDPGGKRDWLGLRILFLTMQKS